MLRILKTHTGPDTTHSGCGKRALNNGDNDNDLQQRKKQKVVADQDEVYNSSTTPPALNTENAEQQQQQQQDAKARSTPFSRSAAEIGRDIRKKPKKHAHKGKGEVYINKEGLLARKVYPSPYEVLVHQDETSESASEQDEDVGMDESPPTSPEDSDKHEDIVGTSQASLSKEDTRIASSPIPSGTKKPLLRQSSAPPTENSFGNSSFLLAGDSPLMSRHHVTSPIFTNTSSTAKVETNDTNISRMIAPGMASFPMTSKKFITNLYLKAVVQEKVIEKVHHKREEVITRDIHTHDVYHHILPVIDVEILPTRHYLQVEGGDLVEVGADEVPDNARVVAETTSKVPSDQTKGCDDFVVNGSPPPHSKRPQVPLAACSASPTTMDKPFAVEEEQVGHSQPEIQEPQYPPSVSSSEDVSFANDSFLPDADSPQESQQPDTRATSITTASTNTEVPMVQVQPGNHIPPTRKNQKIPKTPRQGRKNKKTPLTPAPSKVEKPSARLTRSAAKAKLCTKFEKLDRTGKLAVDWAA